MMMYPQSCGMQKKKDNNVQCGNKASPTTKEPVQKEAISEVEEGKQDGFRVGIINLGDPSTVLGKRPIELDKFDWLHSSSVMKPTLADSVAELLFGKSKQNAKDYDSDDYNDDDNNNEDKEAEYSYGFLALKEIQYRLILESLEKRRREFEARGEQLESVEMQISECKRRLRSLRERFKKELKMWKKAISEGDEVHKKMQREIEECDINIGAKEAELSLLNDLVRECGSKEEELKALLMKTDECTKKLETKEEELDAVQKKIDRQAKELQLERKKLLKPFISMMGLKYLLAKYAVALYTDNQSSPTTDGKSLQLLSNEQTNEPESLVDDILVYLQSSSDPAKLILDIIKDPIVSQCKKGDKVATLDDSCFFLLKQLMRISPHIKPCVREEAMKLALDLKANMRASTEDSVMVLGFQLILSIYGLVSSFNEDELLKIFEFAAQHQQAVELFQILGFVDKISDFVENLTKNQQHIEAVRFICAYRLAEQNQPVDLLLEHVRKAKLICENSCRKTKSVEIKVKARDEEIARLGTVLRCIPENNLECEDLVKVTDIMAFLQKCLDLK